MNIIYDNINEENSFLGVTKCFDFHVFPCKGDLKLKFSFFGKKKSIFEVPEFGI